MTRFSTRMIQHSRVDGWMAQRLPSFLLLLLVFGGWRCCRHFSGVSVSRSGLTLSRRYMFEAVNECCVICVELYFGQGTSAVRIRWALVWASLSIGVDGFGSVDKDGAVLRRNGRALHDRMALLPTETTECCTVD